MPVKASNVQCYLPEKHILTRLHSFLLHGYAFSRVTFLVGFLSFFDSLYETVIPITI